MQQGIYDIALDPDFATNHYYYVFYTLGIAEPGPALPLHRQRDQHRHGRRQRARPLPGSRRTPTPSTTAGRSTSATTASCTSRPASTSTPATSQQLTNPRGKIHRINPDGTVPTDNPFYDGAGPNVDSIWAYGLRNPFRAYYDAPTGRLFIGDVGGNDYSTAKEEVNLGARGANYGWPNCEGTVRAARAPARSTPTRTTGATPRSPAGSSTTASQFPASYQGSYFFADYTQNWIRRLTFDANGNVTGVFNFEPADGSVDGPYGDIVYLTEGPDGALYYVDLGYSDIGGTFGVSKIRRIRYVHVEPAAGRGRRGQPDVGPGPARR